MTSPEHQLRALAEEASDALGEESREHILSTNRGMLTRREDRLVRVYPDGSEEDVGPATYVVPGTDDQEDP